MRKDPKQRHSPDVALCRDRKRLESWKAIANYLGRTVRTTQRWEKQEGLPVRRHLHGRQGSVFAYTAEIDAWRDARSSAPEPALLRPGLLVAGLASAAAIVLAIGFYGGFWSTPRTDSEVAGPLISGSTASVSSETNPDALQQYMIGMDHLARGNYADASVSFGRAAALDASFTRPLGAIALAKASQSGQVMRRATYAEAYQSAMRALAADPESPEAHAALGVIALEQGQVSDAEAYLRKAIAFDAGLVEAHYRLVDILDEQGRFAEADRELEAALKIDPLHPRINEALAKRYQASGDYEMARQRYLAMLELESPPLATFNGLIALEREYGHFDLAFHWGQQLALRQPLYSAFDALISMPARLRMNHEAVKWRNHLATLESVDEPQLGINCKYLYMMQRIEECFATKNDYLARLGLNIEEAPFAVQETFGSMAVLLGRYQEGIEVLERLFRPELRVPEQLGGSEMALMMAQILAHAYRETGRDDDASALLGEIARYIERQMARNRGNRPSMMIAEARNQAMLGNRDQALASLREAIDAGWRDYVYERPHPAWASLVNDASYQALIGIVERDVAAQRESLQSQGLDAEIEQAIVDRIERARAELISSAASID